MNEKSEPFSGKRVAFMPGTGHIDIEDNEKLLGPFDINDQKLKVTGTDKTGPILSLSEKFLFVKGSTGEHAVVEFKNYFELNDITEEVVKKFRSKEEKKQITSILLPVTTKQ